MSWSQRILILYPVDSVPTVITDAIARAFADIIGLESFESESFMWQKAAQYSDDWGATETHHAIHTPMTPALSSAILAILEAQNPPNVLWYVFDAYSDSLLTTNDTGRQTVDWAPDIAVTVGQRWRYRGTWFEVLQAHITQTDWTPDVAKSLFKRYRAPGEVGVWVQPIGAVDAYPVGARVTHDGTTWINTIADNVWEPGVTGWTDENAPQTDEWTYPHHYIGDNTAGAGQGDVVLYVPNGHLYRCRQTHDSIVTWTPPTVPALWLDLGLA